MNSPHDAHWHQLKWLLRYLHSTVDHGITFPASPAIELTSYADADFANVKDKRSVSGIVHTINSSPISWTSARQATVGLSACEAEYLAATCATQQTNWLRRLLHDLHAPPQQPTALHIDNQATIRVALKSVPTKRRKLIDIRHHYLHDHIAKKIITLHHIPSSANPSDLFTKPLGRLRFQELISALNLTKPPSFSSPPRSVPRD